MRERACECARSEAVAGHAQNTTSSRISSRPEGECAAWSCRTTSHYVTMNAIACICRSSSLSFACKCSTEFSLHMQVHWFAAHTAAPWCPASASLWPQARVA